MIRGSTTSNAWVGWAPLHPPDEADGPFEGLRHQRVLFQAQLNMMGDEGIGQGFLGGSKNLSLQLEKMLR